MDMIPVPFASADIAMIGYDPDSLEMNIQFRNGNIYNYKAVEPDTYAQLLQQGGTYFHQIIKPQRDRYIYTRVI